MLGLCGQLLCVQKRLDGLAEAVNASLDLADECATLQSQLMTVRDERAEVTRCCCHVLCMPIRSSISQALSQLVREQALVERLQVNPRSSPECRW